MYGMGIAIAVTSLITIASNICHGDIILGVDARSNLFASGSLSLPSSGVVPPFIAFASGPHKTLTFSNLSGTVRAGTGWPAFGPEGSTGAFGDSIGTNVLSSEGIAGMIHDRFLFLAGVFLEDSAPTARNVPPRLDFRNADEFETLTTVIGQTFFIGDGLTGRGTGSLQQFKVPESATRLFVGFIDSYYFGWPNGNVPSFYDDNIGTISVTVRAVPEPTSFILLSSLAVTILRRRVRRLK